MDNEKHTLKVIFVSSGRNKGQISPIVNNQGESLLEKGIELSYFSIHGKGLKNYIKAVFTLRKILKQIKPDIIHAHYGLCGIVSLFARRKEKIVISFMGSDLIGSYNIYGSYTLAGRILSAFNKFFARYYYNFCIVKSVEMFNKIRRNNNISLIANGVDTEKFKTISKEEAYKKTGLDPFKKNILFISNPGRIEKNFVLAKEAITLLNDDNIQLEVLSEIPNDELIYFYCAADSLLLTSFHEGSPNVVKEAMACNCPVVSTDVGDVKWLFGDLEGYYVSSFDASDICNKIKQSVSFREQYGITKGRNRIFELKLDNNSVAERILQIYSNLIWIK